MNTVLIVLIAMGAIAIATAAYVFTVAARNYVSGDEGRLEQSLSGNVRSPEYHVVRGIPERRRTPNEAPFPRVIDGILVQRDRRSGQERRGDMQPA